MEWFSCVKLFTCLMLKVSFHFKFDFNLCRDINFCSAWNCRCDIISELRTSLTQLKLLQSTISKVWFQSRLNNNYQRVSIFNNTFQNNLFKCLSAFHWNTEQGLLFGGKEGISDSVFIWSKATQYTLRFRMIYFHQ